MNRIFLLVVAVLILFRPAESHSETRKNTSVKEPDKILKAAPASRSTGTKQKKTAGKKKPSPKSPRISPDDTPKKNVTPTAVANKTVTKKIIRKESAPVAVITKITSERRPSGTRIVIYSNSSFSYRPRLTKGKTPKSLQRLTLDIPDSRLDPKARMVTAVDDKRIKSLASSEKSGNTVTVAIDMDRSATYKISASTKPVRLTVDIGSGPPPEPDDTNTDNRPDTQPDSPPAVPVSIPRNPKTSQTDLARQLHLGVRKIVIDAGHGGKDIGAPGCDPGVVEKDVVLSIAKKLSRKISKILGIKTILTRSDDTFISLEDRPRIANEANADLFISIHANAAQDKEANGVETYFLNIARDRLSADVAARENSTSEKSISDLQSILDSLMKNAKITESSKLATYVQSSVADVLSTSYETKNNGVRQAPFYVLVGAKMPAILIETSFISNKDECDLLQDEDYQNELTDGIIEGIRTYIQKTCPKPATRSSKKSKGKKRH